MSDLPIVELSEFIADEETPEMPETTRNTSASSKMALSSFSHGTGALSADTQRLLDQLEKEEELKNEVASLQEEEELQRAARERALEDSRQKKGETEVPTVLTAQKPTTTKRPSTAVRRGSQQVKGADSSSPGGSRPAVIAPRPTSDKPFTGLKGGFLRKDKKLKSALSTRSPTPDKPGTPDGKAKSVSFAELPPSIEKHKAHREPIVLGYKGGEGDVGSKPRPVRDIVVEKSRAKEEKGKGRVGLGQVQEKDAGRATPHSAYGAPPVSYDDLVRRAEEAVKQARESDTSTRTYGVGPVHTLEFGAPSGTPGTGPVGDVWGQLGDSGAPVDDLTGSSAQKEAVDSTSAVVDADTAIDAGQEVDTAALYESDSENSTHVYSDSDSDESLTTKMMQRDIAMAYYNKRRLLGDLQGQENVPLDARVDFATGEPRSSAPLVGQLVTPKLIPGDERGPFAGVLDDDADLSAEDRQKLKEAIERLSRMDIAEEAQDHVKIPTTRKQDNDGPRPPEVGLRVIKEEVREARREVGTGDTPAPVPAKRMSKFKMRQLGLE